MKINTEYSNTSPKNRPIREIPVGEFFKHNGVIYRALFKREMDVYVLNLDTLEVDYVVISRMVQPVNVESIDIRVQYNEL